MTEKNEIVAAKLVKDAKLDVLTIPRVANMAMDKGFPLVRKLFVKPKP